MCGIWSWAGRNKQDFNLSDFNTLGIMNETRGKHSCGVAVDDDIHLGVDGEKLYRDFVANNREVMDIYSTPIAIGHTRHATGGAHNADNAHPFGFYGEDNDADYKFIGVHNGSLSDISTLAKSNGVKNVEVTQDENGVISTRNKIDSEILLESIYLAKDSDNPYKVLEEYTGAAALTFYFVEEPNVVYYYHGASKDYPSSVKITEERPLFYYKASKNSLYTSSIKDSLLVIGGKEHNIGEFDHNTVYKVIDGDIDSAEKFIIDRSIKSQKSFTTNYYGGRHQYLNTTATNINTKSSKLSKRFLNNQPVDNKDIEAIKNLAFEHSNEFMLSHKCKIVFNKLRFSRNGHNITGIYTYIPSYGFYLLDKDDTIDAVNMFKKLIGKTFNDGNFTDGMFNSELIGITPFKVDSFKDSSTYPLFYFYEGILLKTEKDFLSLTINKVLSNISEIQLSYMSKHPILAWHGVSNVITNNIVWEGVDYTGTFSLFYTNRTYKCIKGGINEITEYIECDNSCDLPQDIGKVVNLNKITTTDISKTINKCADNKSVENLLEKFLLNLYTSIPSYIKQLRLFKESKLAKEAIESMTLMDELIIELCPEFRELINEENV